MHKYDNSLISERQFMILIILGIVGDSILILPTVIAKSAKQDAWLSMLAAMVLGLAAGALFAAIANLLHRDSLFTVLLQRLGKLAGTSVSVLLLFFYALGSFTLLSEMSQFMTTQMMPETPINAFITIFIFVIIIAYRYGLEAFARMGELLFPVFMLLFIFLVVFLLPQVEFTNLRPVAADGFVPIMQGALPAFTVGFTEMILLLMLVEHVAGNRKLTKPIMAGYAIGGLLLFIVVLLCVLVLGPNLMETKYYPTFVLAQKIAIGHFLERVEAIITFLWIITVFYKTLLLYFSLTKGISQVFRLKESRMLTIPIGMLLLVGTIASTPNITVYNNLIDKYFTWFDLSICLVLPLLLFLLLRLGRKRITKTKSGT